MSEWNAAVTNWQKLWRGGAAVEIVNVANEEADDCYVRLQKIGRFVPVIKHDPDEDGVAVYPTVSQDVGMAVKLVSKINALILS